MLLILTASPLLAQRDPTQLPPGVSLYTRYTKLGRPLLAVRPFDAADAVRDVASQVNGIVRNDLLLSDRFEMFTTPERLAAGDVDYALWNSLNVVYLVTGDVTVTPAGYSLALTVHDVVYGNVKPSRTFSLPMANAPDFRMAVHAASDEIVRSITNQPGMAASRIVFVRQNRNGSSDLMIVDSDGEDLRRLQGSNNFIYSPTWSPDGRRLAYTRSLEEGWELVEREMAGQADRREGTTRRITSGPLIMTPSYSANGEELYFGMWIDGRAGTQLHVYDAARGCCLRRLTSTSGDNVSPTASADGRQIAFHSTRTGRQHIYVMPAGGGNALQLSPLGDRAEFAAPDWSPTGSQVVFHGQSRDNFHIMLADASRPGAQITQLTSSGRNQDPSWAPDGRHIVYTGVGAGGPGLYVIDVITGENRLLVRGAGLRMADWSPSLSRAVALGANP